MESIRRAITVDDARWIYWARNGVGVAYTERLRFARLPLLEDVAVVYPTRRDKEAYNARSSHKA